jgi:hypothetical protein
LRTDEDLGASIERGGMGSDNVYWGGCAQMYHSMLSRLFEQGAEDPDSPAHAKLVELLALKVFPPVLFKIWLHFAALCSLRMSVLVTCPA